MSDSKIITADSHRGKNLKPHKFIDLSGPVPAALPRGSNFRVADYIKDEAGKHDFAPSFGAGQKKAAAKKAPPTPEELLAQAQSQAETIREQARTEGLQSGQQQAEEETQAQTARLVEASQRLLSAAEEISRLRSDLLTETEGEIVDLIVLAASKVVSQEIKTNRGVVAG
ncbi:MAG: ATP synthase F0 subunit B, partial [Deltaproteobacteria bacterium]|nr:ATP synthase F0 subunit B [Deltaproteobacteria bacterium]